MLSYALTFFLFSLIAGVFGFAWLAGTTATIAKALFVVFLVAFLFSLLARCERVAA